MNGTLYKVDINSVRRDEFEGLPEIFDVSWSSQDTISVLTEDFELILIESDGTVQELEMPVEPTSSGIWSPDGIKLVFQSMGNNPQNYDLWLYENGAVTEIAQGYQVDNWTAIDWSPDSSQIVLTLNQSETINIMDYDGTNLTLLVVGWYPKWSPDGEHIAFMYQGRLWLVDSDYTSG